MKDLIKFCLLSGILLMSCTSRSQSGYAPTPDYDYATLKIIDDEQSYLLEFSHTGKVFAIADTLGIDRKKESLTQVTFKCFQYLNKLGYELVTANSFWVSSNNILLPKLQSLKSEYIFKRPFRKESDK